MNTRIPGSRLVAKLPETKSGDWKLTALEWGSKSLVVAIHPEHLPQMYEVTEGAIYTWEMKLVTKNEHQAT